MLTDPEQKLTGFPYQDVINTSYDPLYSHVDFNIGQLDQMAKEDGLTGDYVSSSIVNEISHALNRDLKKAQHS